MNIGEKLKSLRKHYGFTQAQLEEKLGVLQKNISNYESTNEPGGVLDYILKFCDLINMPVEEFFMEDLDDLKRKLPDYITPADAAVLKILNTAIDAKTRIEVKQVFIHTMKVALMQYKDKLQHMPEFKKLFGEED